MIEEWRDIAGYEGAYKVSSEGRVLSLARWVKHPTAKGGFLFQEQRILKQSTMGGGYFKVGLHKDGEMKTRPIHRLVAEAFIGPCPPGLEAAHFDGINTNNHVSNLRYDTHKNNNHDKYRHGTHRQGQRTPNAKLTESNVKEIRSAQGTMREIGARFNIAPQTVSKIRLRQSWQHIPQESTP